MTQKRESCETTFSSCFRYKTDLSKQTTKLMNAFTHDREDAEHSDTILRYLGRKLTVKGMLRAAAGLSNQ